LVKKYPNGSYALEVRPMVQDERKAPYNLIVKMTDKNVCPKTSKQIIRIQVPMSQKLDIQDPLRSYPIDSNFKARISSVNERGLLTVVFF
jgi:hypothetical protein